MRGQTTIKAIDSKVTDWCNHNEEALKDIKESLSNVENKQDTFSNEQKTFNKETRTSLSGIKNRLSRVEITEAERVDDALKTEMELLSCRSNLYNLDVGNDQNSRDVFQARIEGGQAAMEAEQKRLQMMGWRCGIVVVGFETMTRDAL